jgi:hypothetical protein
MITATEPVVMERGRLAGNVDSTVGWSIPPSLEGQKQLRLFLGDPASGPAVWIYNGAHAKPRPTPYVHHHRSDSLRIGVGYDREQIKYGKKWHGAGEFHLLEANSAYHATFGAQEYRVVLLFADRRGLAVASKDTRDFSSEALIEFTEDVSTSFDGRVPVAHTTDEAVAPNIQFSTGETLSAGRFSGSMFDTSTWGALSDGSRLASVGMGDSQIGPLVIFSDNVTGAVESPASHYESDTFRLIVRGSCWVDGTLFEEGSFLAAEAGQEVGPVVHGDGGSKQVLFVADRRAWRPRDPGMTPVRSERLDEMARYLRT